MRARRRGPLPWPFLVMTLSVDDRFAVAATAPDDRPAWLSATADGPCPFVDSGPEQEQVTGPGRSLGSLQTPFFPGEKLREEKIKIELPNETEIDERLTPVLTTIYLLFNEGYYSVSQNNTVRKDLCLEAMRLCTMLIENKNDYSNNISMAATGTRRCS